MMKRRVGVAVSIGAVLMVVLAMSFQGFAPRGTEPAPGENSVDATGHRTWHGSASEELEHVSDEVATFADSHHDVFAGAALTSDNTMVEVYATSGSKHAINQLKREVGAPFDQFVRVVPVQHSLAELTDADQQILQAGLPSGDVVSVGTDLSRNTVDIGLSRQAFAEAEQILADSGIDARTATLTSSEISRVYPALAGLHVDVTLAEEGAATSDEIQADDLEA